MKKGVAIGIGCSVFLLIGLACAGLFGGLAWFGFGMYKETTKAADSFLAQVGSGDVKGAYDSSSATLRQQQTLEQFTSSVKSLGLTEYQSASWTSFNIVNDQGTVEGTMTTKTGGPIPLKVTMIKESGTWRVSGVTSTATGVNVPAEPKPLPSDDELKKLATTSLLDFNKSVQKKDFTNFYATLSELWKRQTTPDKLGEAFKDFVAKQINISSITDLTAVFEKKPAIGTDGTLELDGYYPTKPLKVRFALKYTYEHPNWKLMAIRVKTED